MVDKFCDAGCKAIDMDRIDTGNIAHYKGNAKAHYFHFKDYFKNVFNRKLNKTVYVWVTYDPLYEKVICIHKKGNSYCKKCKKIWDEREAERCLYQLETSKFKIKP